MVQVSAASRLTTGSPPGWAVALGRAVALEVSRSLRDHLDLRAVALKETTAYG